MSAEAPPGAAADGASGAAETTEVVCDHCDEEIAGISYRCTVCPNFDLCFMCKALLRHPEHPLERVAVSEGDAGDKTVSMEDLEAHEGRLREESAAMLGDASLDACSFTRANPAARQPLYVCATCTTGSSAEAGESGALLCLACSLNCHADHTMIELYTKRNTLCECGRKGPPCTLCPDKSAAAPAPPHPNARGLFCVCRKPYDPDRDVMAMCCVCEDWFHTNLQDELHQPVLGGDEGEGTEFVCASCFQSRPVLWDYAGAGPADPALTCRRPPARPASESSRPQNAFVPNLRARLCTCPDCKTLYDELSLSFLLDPDDTLASFQRRGVAVLEQRAEEEEQKALASFGALPLSTQRSVAAGLADLRTALRSLAEERMAEGREVTAEDIAVLFQAKRPRSDD